MAFDRVDDVLPNRLNRLKPRPVTDTLAVQSAVDAALGDLWQHAVPMRAMLFRAGKVTVAVISSAWGHEVARKAARIRDAANTQLPGRPVKEIATRIAPEQAERSKG